MTEQMSNNKILVIKCGGSIINNVNELNNLIEDIAALKLLNYQIVLVHGGGPDINSLCTALNIKSSFVDGLRVTTEEVLNITQMALLGKTNNNLVYKLNLAKIKAIGLSGHDANLLIAKFTDQAKFGFVGDIIQVHTDLINQLLNLGLMPVIAPLAVDMKGNTLNVNADLAAAGVASALQADKLILLSDIDGFYLNYPDKNSIVRELTSNRIEQLLGTKDAIAGGMLPKLTACLVAVNSSVNSAHIVNGNTHNAILQVINKPNSIGTIVVKG